MYFDDNVDESTYINPLTGYGFKRVFGDKEVMIAFLTDLLKPKSPIEDVAFFGEGMCPKYDNLRGEVYNLECRTKDGKESLIRIQNKIVADSQDVMLIDFSRFIDFHIKKGTIYSNGRMKSVRAIFLLCSNLCGFEPQPVRTTQLTIEETNEVLLDEYKIFTLESKGFRNKPKDYPKNEIEYWLYNLTNIWNMENELPFQDKQPAFKRMAELARMSSLSKEEKIKYQMSLDALRTDLTILENEREDGREEGIEIGKKKGKEEGKREESFLIAKKMKEEGLPIDVIIKCTNLSKEDIDQLD